MTRCNSQYIADTYTQSGFQIDAFMMALSANQIEGCRIVSQSDDL